MFRLQKWSFHLLLIALMSILVDTFSSAYGQDESLPLLSHGTHIGVVYSEGSAEGKAATDQAFADVIAAGVDVYQVSMYWSMLEPTSGNLDTSTLDQFLTLIQTTGMTPYLVIPTIDTVRLALPSDLVDPSDPALLADGRHFDDPVILEHFNALLDAVVPLLVEHGVFFIAVGNEIDPWLATHPNEVQPFLHFFTNARTHIHELAPNLGVGVAITYSGINQGVPFIEQFLAESDAASFTYYPLNNDFTVKDPASVEDDIALLVEAAGELPVLLQEVGYPSGYLPTPTNESSVEMQRQFIANTFDAIQAYPQIRFVSFLSLVDLSPETCGGLSNYYGTLPPEFREYLCSLGMITYNGNAKPAFDEFMRQLTQFYARGADQ